MVMTVLEAHVKTENWTALERTFVSETAALPPPILQTFLVQSTTEPTMWRITTLWRSREALEAYRQSVETPGGVLIFRAVDEEPKLSIFDVRVNSPGLD